MLAIAIIGLLIGVYSAFLKTLEHFNLTLPGFGKLLARQSRDKIFVWGKIHERIYIAIASIISLLFLSVLVSSVALNIVTNNGLLGLLLLDDMLILGIMGVWVPVLHNKRLSKIINIIGACLLALLFAGFWIYQWPDWHTPALLTSLIIIMSITVLVFALTEKRKRKAKAQVVNASK